MRVVIPSLARRLCRWVMCACAFLALLAVLKPMKVHQIENFSTNIQKKNVSDNIQPKSKGIDENVNKTNRMEEGEKPLNDEGDERNKQTNIYGKTRRKENETEGSLQRAPTEGFPYRYLINEENVCNRDTEIINLIPIGPKMVKHRDVIRSLWGNRNHSSVTKMKTLFVIGVINSVKLQIDLKHESNKYHDIIQLDFVDSYANLTLKTLSILHWSGMYCPSAKWILKSDDDVLVNSFSLSRFLLHRCRGKDIICRMNERRPVCRKGAECYQKWAVTEQEYHGDFYPPYCNGPAYILSSSFAKKLYEKALNSTLFRMEDVFFTGILARNLGPKYLYLTHMMFPDMQKNIKKFYWEGTALMVLDLQRFDVDFTAVWRNITRYENIEFNGKWSKTEVIPMR